MDNPTLIEGESMGDSIVEAAAVENKMQESVASAPSLGVSVSFGRFNNDSLSWEKWSTFSPNKYLEEVEKCSTPGSVAQKAAYFEAHYKKIAARKVELQEHETPIEIDPSRSDVVICESHTEKESRTEDAISVSNGKRSDEEIVQDIPSINMESETEANGLNGSQNHILEFQNSLVVETKKELDDEVNSPELNDQEELSLVKEEALVMVTQDTLEYPSKAASEAVKVYSGDVESQKHNAQKVGQTSKKQNLVREKGKLVPSGHKSPLIPTPRLSKPASTSPVNSTSRTSTKTNASSLPRNMRLSVKEGKRPAPTTLHMSLSLGPANSDSVSKMRTRKSLIMERMGDKDIVKRAFKTFQNVNQLRSFNDERSSLTKKASIREPEKKTVPLRASQKENEGIKKAPEKMNTNRTQMGTRWNSMSAGSRKGAVVDERKGKAAPSSIGFRSNERAEKEKVITKKEGKKFPTRKAEKFNLDLKSKEEKAAAIKNLTRSLNLNSTSVSGIYNGQGTSKLPIQKKGATDRILRPTESHW